MSRIGKRPIPVPSGVTITVGKDNMITVKGPKGELTRQFAPTMGITREENTIVVTRPNDEGKQRALHGLHRTLLSNMVTGVSTGFVKTLEVQGVGYRDWAMATGLLHEDEVAALERSLGLRKD